MMNQRTEAMTSILLSLKRSTGQIVAFVTAQMNVPTCDAHLTGPAKNTAVKQVNRPTDTTAIWLPLPCCHTTWAFSVTCSGSSSHRP